MSMDLYSSCSFRLQELHMANCSAPTAFNGVLRCIQKIYGLACIVQRHYEPQPWRLDV